MPEAVLFCGLQGSGKSTFFAERFASTHVRLNLDMLKTRNREDVLLHACLSVQQSFVVDNTNPRPEQRRRYTNLAKAAGYEVHAYYFDVPADECSARNAKREGDQRVPDLAIYGTAAKLVVPTKAEGFDRLFVVRWSGREAVVEEVP